MRFEDAAAEEEKKARWARRRERDLEAEALENARLLAEVTTTDKMTLRDEEAEAEAQAQVRFVEVALAGVRKGAKVVLGRWAFRRRFGGG